MLSLSARVSGVTARLLRWGAGDSPQTGDDEHEQRISRYADQPRGLSDGAWQGLEALQDGIVGGLRAVTLDPVHAYQQHGTWVIFFFLTFICFTILIRFFFF